MKALEEAPNQPQPRPAANDPAIFLWYRQNRRAYIEDFFKIVPRDPSKGLIPFRFKPVQHDYWTTRTARDIYVKARQVAISSIIEADYTSAAMLYPGIRVLCPVQKPEEKTVPHHMNRVKTYYHSIPEPLRPRLNTSNAFSMEFGFGPPGEASTMLSRIDFVSAGSFEAARGGTYHFVHITEFDSFEEQEANALLQALLGVPSTARIVIEGSPKKSGGTLHTMWKQAKGSDSSYTGHLYPWFWEEEYVSPAEDFPEDLSADERALIEFHTLTPPQIAWRRRMLREAMSQAPDLGEQKFLSEYLEDDERCWAMSGLPALPVAFLDRLLAQSKPPISTSLNGALKMWLPREDGEGYVIGADPAEGLAHSHMSAATIRRVRDWAHVGTLQGHFPPGEFGGLLVQLGKQFNMALLAWERNNHGHGVDVKIREQLHYPFIYRYPQDKLPGFPSNRWTKPDLVGLTHEAMTLETWQSQDSELIGQFRMMQDLGDGRYDTGTLDLASSDMITLIARDQAKRVGRPRAEPTPNIPRWMRRS